MATFSELLRDEAKRRSDAWNPSCDRMGRQKPVKPERSAREVFQDYINADGLIDVDALSSKQRCVFLTYITVAQIEHHLERLSSDTVRCNSMTSQSDCKRKLNKIRKHAKEHFQDFVNDDGFLELSKLTTEDKHLLMSCVSADQMDQFTEAFETFDVDDDGSISSKELRVVLNSLGVEPTEDVLKEILSEVDADGNGMVDVHEFLVFMASRTLYKDEDQNIRDAFKQFDKDGNGYIDRDELRSLMITLGEKLTDEEIDEMMQEADFDRDGKISYQEFYIMMKLTY
uniref:EF-hand_1 domain-containing protein n=1 Tax=Charistephane fugiens TaxID=140462 RepID=V9PPW6_9METZ|nr:EF-hand_1 domain-containing protein [Charistephane fugiens]